MPGSAHTIFTADAAELEFKGCPFKAVCDLRTGRTGFSLSKADWLYKQFLLAMKEFGTHEAVSAYLREKGIDASVYYAGKPGQFRILFRFPLSTETENVEIESAYKRIVLAARKRAAEKALVKEKEKAAQLKSGPDLCRGERRPAYKGAACKSSAGDQRLGGLCFRGVCGQVQSDTQGGNCQNPGYADPVWYSSRILRSWRIPEVLCLSCHGRGKAL